MKLISNNKIDIKHKFCPDDYQMNLITDIMNDHFFIKGFKCERILGNTNIETQLVLAIKDYTEEQEGHENQSVVVFIKQLSGEYYVVYTEFYLAYCSGNHDRSIYYILSQLKEMYEGNILFFDEDYYCDDELISEYGDL
jgi:hypothetical protein